MAVTPGSITLPWADGEHSFRLAIGDWQELYRKLVRLFMRLGLSESAAMAASTPMAVYKRIGGSDPVPGEVGELIFQALIGAGMDSQGAMALRKRYVDDKPLLGNVEIAQAVILHSLMGPPEPEQAPKKAEAEEQAPSPSADSTATARRSATRPSKLTK